MTARRIPIRRASEQLSFVYRGLKHPNYRLFFCGQILSLVGTWLSTVATSWLVYRLARETMPERSAMILGFVGFAGQIPVFLVTPFAGVWVDRMNRHRILVVTQLLSMIQSFALAYLALSGNITIPQIIVLSLLQGIVNAFDMPARQAFVVEIVDKREDLANAIALNSSMVHTARMVGPSIAGFLIFTVGEGYCFLIDGFSYFAVLIALLFIKVKARKPAERRPAWMELREGFNYAFTFKPISALLTLVATASLMFISQSVLMPIVADKVLSGNERTLGALLGASGFGALMASLYLASRKSVLGLGNVIRNSAFTVGVGFIILAMSKYLPFSMLMLTITGGATVLLNASCNTVLQTIVDDDKRGRIMSLFTLAFMGMAPFGSLFSGSLANRIGAPQTFAVCGVICLISASYFARKLVTIRPMIRPIYQRKGILPMPDLDGN